MTKVLGLFTAALLFIVAVPLIFKFLCNAFDGFETFRVYLNSLTMSLAVLSQSALTTTLFLSTPNSISGIHSSKDVIISRSNTFNRGLLSLTLV